MTMSSWDVIERWLLGAPGRCMWRDEGMWVAATWADPSQSFSAPTIHDLATLLLEELQT